VDEGDIGAGRMRRTTRAQYVELMDSAGAEALGATTDSPASGNGSLIAVLKYIRSLLASVLGVSITDGSFNYGTDPGFPLFTTGAAHKTDDAAFTPGTTQVVMAGFEADEASTDAVDEGDAGAARMSLKRVQYANPTSDTAACTQVADTASSTTLLSANSARTGCSIQNTSSGVLYVKCGATATTTDFTVRLIQYAYWEAPYGYKGRIDGIWATDPNDGAAVITEYS
jgi:hypothetical protein